MFPPARGADGVEIQKGSKTLLKRGGWRFHSVWIPGDSAEDLPARQIPPDRAGGKLVDEQRFFRSDGVISIGGLRLRRWHQRGATRSQRRRREKSPPATKGLGPECRGPSLYPSPWHSPRRGRQRWRRRLVCGGRNALSTVVVLPLSQDRNLVTNRYFHIF